jgi:phosphatidylinositol kinase/protein kinase (PI-3  family)
MQTVQMMLSSRCNCYPPTVFVKWPQVLDCIRQHSPSLVEQAQLVSHELIRMAILWHEMWHEVRPAAAAATS